MLRFLTLLRQGIERGLSHIAIFFITLYQKTISPDKSLLFRHFLAGRICAHEPHCSAYAKQCFQRYSFFTALHYTMERVSTCVPSYTQKYDPASYRVVFFSSAPIGIPFLHQLATDARFDLVGVVTMPDAPSGRGMKMHENIVKQETKQIPGEVIPVYTPRSLRLDSKKYADDAQEFREWATALQPDLFVVIAYGHIMPQRVLDLPVFGSINVHGSLLPAYRGASPLQSVFLEGKKETGITIMKMDAGVDTGDMIKKLTTPLSLHWTVIDLIDWIKTHGPRFLTNTLRQRGKGLLEAKKQDEQQATLSRKFEKEDGQIDPLHDSLSDIRPRRQAFALWPKLYFSRGEKRITIDQFLLDDKLSTLEGDNSSLIMQSGGIYILHPAVTTIRLIPEGKKPLTWEEFLHGYGKIR